MEDIKENFLGHVFAKDFTSAEQAFKTAMAEKVAAALGARRVEIAQSLYQKAQ